MGTCMHPLLRQRLPHSTARMRAACCTACALYVIMHYTACTARISYAAYVRLGCRRCLQNAVPGAGAGGARGAAAPPATGAGASHPARRPGAGLAGVALGAGLKASACAPRTAAPPGASTSLLASMPSAAARGEDGAKERLMRALQPNKVRRRLRGLRHRLRRGLPACGSALEKPGLHHALYYRSCSMHAIMTCPALASGLGCTPRHAVCHAISYMRCSGLQAVPPRSTKALTIPEEPRLHTTMRAATGHKPAGSGTQPSPAQPAAAPAHAEGHAAKPHAAHASAGVGWGASAGKRSASAALPRERLTHAAQSGGGRPRSAGRAPRAVPEEASVAEGAEDAECDGDKPHPHPRAHRCSAHSDAPGKSPFKSLAVKVGHGKPCPIHPVQAI